MSKYPYYLRSIPTLLSGFTRPARTVGIFLGLTGLLPAEVELRREGWRFTVRSALDMWVLKETCLDGGYMGGREFEPAWTIIDVGAGIGDFTVLAAKSCPEGLVHAYEPHGESYKIFRHNLSVNNLPDVVVYREAGGTAGGRYLSLDSSGEPISTPFVEGENSASVSSSSLEQMLQRLPNARCDLIKIDCEGCEFNLIMKADPPTLDRISYITMELHDEYQGYQARSLVNYLKDMGFEVEQKPNPVHDNLSHLFASH
jgi:FkbM family methyltransferase